MPKWIFQKTSGDQQGVYFLQDDHALRPLLLSSNARAVGTRWADPLFLHFSNHLSLRQGQIDNLITAYPPGISDLPDSSPFSDPRQFVTSLFSALIGGTLNSQSVR